MLCFKAFVCKAMYEDDNNYPTAIPNGAVTGRMTINATTQSSLKANIDGFKSAGVTVSIDYPSTLAAPTVQDIKATSARIRWNPPGLKASQTRVTIYVLNYENSKQSINIRIPAPVSTHVITGLAVFTNYSVRIKALSRIGPGQWSMANNFTTNSTLPVASPLSVTVNVLTSQTMRVTWKAPTSQIYGPILGYKVIVTPTSSSSEEASRNLTTKLTTCIIGNLLKWTEYNISVCVFNDKGRGPAVYVIERTAEDAPSQPPQYFNVTVFSSTSVQLSWGLPPIDYRNGIIRGFEFFYKKNSQNENATVTNLPGNGTLRHVLGGLEKYTRYTFKVLAYTNKKGPYSKSIDMTTLQDEPSAPANLQTQIIPPRGMTGPQINITWDEPEAPNGIIQSYTVFCNSTRGSFVIHLHNEQTVTLPVIGGLMYSCRVKAKTIKFGNESTTRIIVPIYAPPTAPQNVTYYEINATTFIVEWQPLNTTNGPVTMYELIIQNSKQIKQIALRSKAASTDLYEKMNATCCSVILYGRSPCSVYVLSIRAYSHAGPGPASKSINMITSEPGPPTRLHVSNVGKREVTLKWNKPDAVIEPVIEYKISFNGTNLWEKDIEVNRGEETSTKETATISGLNPSTHYQFQVSAETDCGAGKKSKITTANTSVDAPPSPLVEYITNINESISNIPLWGASNVNGMISAYQVIVLERIDASDKTFDAEKLTNYSQAKENRLSYYIAAQIGTTQPGQTLPRSFTLGDENIYNTYKNMKLAYGKSYYVFQRAMTLDEEKEYLAGRASLIGRGKIPEHGGPCAVQRPSQKIVKSNDSMYLFISLAFNVAFIVIFTIFLFYIKSIKNQFKNKGLENSEVTASTSMQVIYENTNAEGAEEGLAMTFLSQGPSSDYEQIDLINSEVAVRPVASACNSLYQSIHFEEESDTEPNLNQEKHTENPLYDSKKMNIKKGLQKLSDEPVTRACESLYQSIHLDGMRQSHFNFGQEKLHQKGDEIPSILQPTEHQDLQKEQLRHEYQGLHEDCNGKNKQATAYQPLQKEQQQYEYINQSYKENDKAAAKHLAAYQNPKKTQDRPVYQSLHEDFKQTPTKLPVYQSLAKGQAEYVNQIAKGEKSISQPANYQALQHGYGQTKPNYQSLQEDSKESTVEVTNYQALAKPVYQSLHTYGNAEPKQTRKRTDCINGINQ